MRLWCVLVVVLAAALRTAEMARRALQVDEGLTLYLAGLKLPAALQFMRDHDPHPPLLTVTVHALVWAHAPDWLIRVLFVLLGTASVALVMAVVRQWSSDRAAVIAGVFAACMPLLIFNDIMIRMYAPFGVFALLSFYLLSRVLVRDDLPAARRRMFWIGWTLCTIAMLYTLYAAFFVLACQLAYGALVRRDAVWKLLAGAAVAGVAWLPQLPTFLYQLPEGGISFPGYVGREFELIATLPEQATLQIPYAGVLGVALVAVVWIWAGVALYSTIRARRGSLLPWIGAPALLTLVYSVAAHKLLYTDRYYTLFAYALCCWTGAALGRWTESLLKSGRRVALAPAVVACLLIGGVAGAHVTDPYHSTADWNKIGLLLTSVSKPHDLFIFEQGSPIWVLGRNGALAGHPLLVVFDNEQPARILDSAKPYDRVWYVRFESWPVDPADIVLRGLQRQYRLLRYWRFDDALASEVALVAQFERSRRQGFKR